MEMDEGCVSRPRLQVSDEGWLTGPDFSSTKVTAFFLGQTRGSLFPELLGPGLAPSLSAQAWWGWPEVTGVCWPASPSPRKERQQSFQRSSYSLTCKTSVFRAV